MAETVLTQSSLIRLDSWRLPSILDSPNVDGNKFSESCSVAAKMAFPPLSSDEIRAFQNECRPSPTKAALVAHALPEHMVAADKRSENIASTSHLADEVFSQMNFTDFDVAQHAESLFNKGPMRSFSSRAFDALLDDGNLRDDADWCNLNTLPSLQRLPSLTNTEDPVVLEPPPCDPEPEVAPELEPLPPASEESPGEAEEARRKAVAARARAVQARRFATQKTAAATALTMHAKEILDVAAAAKGRARGIENNSGLLTPNLTQDRHALFSSDSVTPTSSSGFKAEGKARGKAGVKREYPDDTSVDDTLFEDGGAIRKPKVLKKQVMAEKPRGIQATDSIITSNGKKCRRGCLNCQAQKTPQWRMGPEGPKTLCNACGVRYRKGLPL